MLRYFFDSPRKPSSGFLQPFRGDSRALGSSEYPNLVRIRNRGWKVPVALCKKTFRWNLWFQSWSFGPAECRETLFYNDQQKNFPDGKSFCWWLSTRKLEPILADNDRGCRQAPPPNGAIPRCAPPEKLAFIFFEFSRQISSFELGKGCFFWRGACHVEQR